MSTIADPKKARLWADFDAFRAPVYTPRPTDESIFTSTPSTSITGGTPSTVAWNGFGGVEAGFDVKPDRDIKKLMVSNYKDAAYRVSRGPKSNRIAMRPVDYSVASVLTALQGGQIVESSSGSGVWEWQEGQEEDFALLLNVYDGDHLGAFYCERVTLATPPPRKFDTESLDGWELELECLGPLVPFTNDNPLVTTP